MELWFFAAGLLMQAVSRNKSLDHAALLRRALTGYPLVDKCFFGLNCSDKTSSSAAPGGETGEF